MKLEKKQKIYNHLVGKASLGQQEAVNADGGYAVDQDLLDIISPNILEGSIYDRALKLTVSGSGAKVPRFDPSNVNDTGFCNARGYWIAEGGDKQRSKFVTCQADLTLNKVVVLIPSTDELIEDVEALPSYINYAGGNALRYQLDRAIIYGNDAFSMGGVVGSGDEATIYITEGANIRATVQLMYADYYGGENGIWVVSQDKMTAIRNGLAADFGYDPVTNTLYGYPIYVCHAMNQGDILLGDFSQYLVVQKDIRKDVASHVEFVTDQVYFKTQVRVNGAPIWCDAATLESGDIVAPFVALSSMNGEEESSEEWVESESSSSSSQSSSSSSTSLSSQSSESSSSTSNSSSSSSVDSSSSSSVDSSSSSSSS